MFLKFKFSSIENRSRDVKVHHRCSPLFQFASTKLMKLITLRHPCMLIFLFILRSASIKQAIFFVLEGNKFHMPSQIKCFLGVVDKVNNHSRSNHDREVIIKLNRKPVWKWYSDTRTEQYNFHNCLD